MKLTKAIALVLCLGMLLCVMTACSSKTPQTVSGFTEVMEAASFEVQDVTADKETNDLATAVLVAVGENFQIEFYELIDSETGEGVFYNNKKLFTDEHSVTTMSSEVTSGNYNYFAFNADGNFHMIARVDNTMLWCEAAKEYKDEIVEFVKTLGYK